MTLWAQVVKWELQCLWNSTRGKIAVVIFLEEILPNQTKLFFLAQQQTFWIWEKHSCFILPLISFWYCFKHYSLDQVKGIIYGRGEIAEKIKAANTTLSTKKEICQEQSFVVVSCGNIQSPNELIGDRGERKLIKYKADKLCRHPKVNSESIFRD